ncbi:MAG: M1 family aminopeptidase [Acidimicrobiia bacterium]
MLQLDPDARRVAGSLVVRFRPDAPIDRLVFRLWPNAPRPGGAGARLEVSDPSVDGRPAIGSYEAAGAAAGTAGTVYSVALPGPVAPGVEVSARVGFTLAMPGVVNDRVSQSAASMRLGSVLPTLSWVRGEGWTTSPAVNAFAEAAVSEVADYDVTVTAPEGWSVLATGEEREPGRFVASGVRDWAATAGRMRTASTTAEGSRIVVVAGVSEGSGDDPAVVAQRAAVALDALASRFGSYPYGRLSIGVTPGLSGGIEFPQHIHLGSRVPSVHLVHEVAHQWFYGMVGNDQFRHPWLDEGLAAYAEGRVSGRLASQRRRSLPAAGRGKLGESMAYWEGRGRVYFTSVYVGGLQALGAYADEVGGYEALDCALRRFTRDHTYRVARPEDLFGAMEAQTGIDPRPVFARFGA